MFSAKRRFIDTHAGCIWLSLATETYRLILLSRPFIVMQNDVLVFVDKSNPTWRPSRGRVAGEKREAGKEMEKKGRPWILRGWLRLWLSYS